MPLSIDHWLPYEPSTKAPWNRRRAVHLHRRAAFAATWRELERDLVGSPQDAVTRVLAGQSRLDGLASDYDATIAMLVDAAAASQLDRRLKAAWVYRMLFSPDPLTERLVLVWHNHFATSNRKVKNLKFMQQQNDALRRHARGPFGELLLAAVHSPAMLVWLDADKNLVAHPNENLGRELMELFTLGIGHYTEADVGEAARALTGWKVVVDEFRFDRARHDDGDKTILGQTAKFDGDSFLATLVEQPATARRVAWRIATFLVGEAALDEAALDALAASLRASGMNIGAAVETVLRSERFFSQNNLAAKVAAPPEYAVNCVRALECFAPPPSTLLLADWMARMGQDLFYPPNVGGWQDGRAWLTSGNIVARANFATALADGRLVQSTGPPDFGRLVARHAADANLSQSIAWLGELLFGGLNRETLGDIETEAAPRAVQAGGALSAAVLIMLARPEAQLT
jgi:uncharacterized protein (DUF1800 family)